MMAEHAQSGMSFAGRVSQVVTVSVGLDDWEWGVTLWARNRNTSRTSFIACVFDEAALSTVNSFGAFYVGYLMSAAEITKHCRLAD